MNRSLKILLFLLFTLVLISLMLFFFESGMRNNAQASGVSIENTYCFASPLKARAGGAEKIRITCFLINEQGAGVSGKSFKLLVSQNLAIEYQQATSDALGKVVADVASQSPGQFPLSFVFDGHVSGQKITASFY